jgi:hypothetical protein
MERILNTFYHVDTTGQLRAGMTIDLVPGKASLFGQIYQRRFRSAGVTTQLELGCPPPMPDLLSPPAYREYFLELFRLHNPEIKRLATVSRLNAFFAFRCAEDVKRYLERFSPKNSPRVYTIHCTGEHPAFDMTWLDQTFPRDINAFRYYYESYWKGLLISEDEHLSSHEKRGSLLEVLITSPVTIGNQIDAQNDNGVDLSA